MIGGILKSAPSLTAFGNPTSVSYLRFIARSESPLHICWSTGKSTSPDTSTSLGSFKQKGISTNCRETIEYRGPDAFADTHLLLAGLVLATKCGLQNSKQALKVVRALHVETSDKAEKKLPALPGSCSESAENLIEDRKFYEDGWVFPRKLIDRTL